MSEAIRRLLDLPENWDSYGAPKIDPKIAETADRLMAMLATPAQAVPTSSGGIQLEWHCNSDDLEIEIGADGKIEVDFELKTVRPVT